MQISSKIAAFLALFVAIFNFIVTKFVFNITAFSDVIFASAILFAFTFFIIKFSFRYFIKNRIKPIFKTLYKGGKQEGSDKSLEEIEQDAIEFQQKKDLNISNLQKQIDFRKEFLGNISHELKTPLFSVQGYVDTLLDGGLEDDNINIAYLKKASKNIERLSDIISDIDLISKIEGNALELNKTTFDIEKLIKETIEDLELLADNNDIEVKFDSKTKNSKATADKERIKEVLINLISNSLKYGKNKGETKISIYDIEDKILIRISDNGLGIKKEQLPRIFERFYRIDDNRSRMQGGSGLGLAIVKHLIEAHNQTVSVKSEFGVGSTFEFTLDK